MGEGGRGDGGGEGRGGEGVGGEGGRYCMRSPYRHASGVGSLRHVASHRRPYHCTVLKKLMGRQGVPVGQVLLVHHSRGLIRAYKELPDAKSSAADASNSTTTLAFMPVLWLEGKGAG